MTRRAALLAFLACAAPPLHSRQKVWVDADTDASGVAAALEEQLQLEGFAIVRGDAPGVLHLELGIRRPPSPWPRAGENAYTLKISGRDFESLDQTCLRAPSEPLFECQARNLLARAREAGALR